MLSDDELRRRLYVPNFEHWKNLCTKEYFSDREPKIKIVEDGIILPARKKEYKEDHRYVGGVCDRELKFVAGYSNIAPGKMNGWCCLDAAYEIDRKEIEQSAEEVIWGGALICHFGHIITECMARMWYVVEHPEDQRRVVFLRVNTWKVAPWLYELFELVGLPQDRIVILDKPTQFAKIVVPEQSSRIKYNYTSKFLLPFRKAVANVEPIDGAKKIFLTRGKDLNSQMYLANQQYFEDFYRARGFEIVTPEKLSIRKQIAVITGADEIAAFMGTLAHWSLFCREGVKWTFLTRVDEFTSRQCLINEATGIDWYLVSTSRNFMYSDQGGGVCLIGSTEHWRRYVRDHFGETLDDEVIPDKVFDDYVDHWCRYFVKPEHMKHRLKTLKNIYSRMSILEMQLKLKRPVLCYQAHQAKNGWLPINVEGDVGGELNKKLSVQALRIYFSEPFCDVYYSVYYPNEGWSDAVCNREQAGVTGKNKAIYGLSVRLSDREYIVAYRVHNFNGEWSPWQKDGDKIMSPDHMIDGVQLRVIPRGGVQQ